MDRTADIFLQKAFIELTTFTIPEVGAFTRPESGTKLEYIPLKSLEEVPVDAKSLIDFLVEDCGKESSEAEAIQAKIRVALRSSLKLREQYYIQGAGTIRQVSNLSDSLIFIPEPGLLKSWFPVTSQQTSDISPEPKASGIRKYALAGLIVSLLIIAVFGFFLTKNSEQKTAQPTRIAIAPTPKEDSKTTIVKPDIETDLSSIDTSQATRRVSTSEDQEDDSGPSFTDKMAVNINPNPDDFIIPNITPYPEPENMRGMANSDSAAKGPQYHIIAASGLTKAAASRFCSYIRYPESCELLPLPGNPGKFRVSIFRAKGQSSARVRRTYYRSNGCPDCWVFPPLPKQ